MPVCRWIEWKIFQGFFKNKKEKHMKGLSFITQFKIEILLPFTGFRKVLGKMLDSVWFLSTRGLLQYTLNHWRGWWIQNCHVLWGTLYVFEYSNEKLNKYFFISQSQKLRFSFWLCNLKKQYLVLEIVASNQFFLSTNSLSHSRLRVALKIEESVINSM